MIKKPLFLIILFFLLILNAKASDSIKIDINEAEKQFVEKNYNLLIQKLNIDVAKAAIVQAKLWDNPSFFYENSAYHHPSNTNKPDKYFPVAGDTARQYAIQVQQLFVLAGKRNKKVKLEQLKTEIAEYQFYDLMRSLKYELRTTFWNLYFSQKTITEYNGEIESLSQLVKLYDIQRKKGNIPLTEVVRLKSFLFVLENERKEVLSKIYEDQKSLNLLLGTETNQYFIPQVNEKYRDPIDVNQISVEKLIDTAIQNRFDLKAQESLWKAEEQNLVLQKSLAVPDLMLGAIWDKRSNYIVNYLGVQASIDIPTFNRNQGNILAAKASMDAAKYAKEAYELQVVSEVYNSINQLKSSDGLYKGFDSNFMDEFSGLIDGIKINYEKRNVPLVEFIDYYESYKNSYKQMMALQNDRFKDFEFLNFTLGVTLY